MSFARSLPILCLSIMAVAQSVTVHKSLPTSQDLTPEQQASVVKLSNLQRNFGKSSTNSPGVQLSLKEISRSRTTDRTLVKYELFTTGLPKNLTYTLFQVQIDGQTFKVMDGVTLDPDGRAICVGPKDTRNGNASSDPVDLIMFAATAEPKRLILVSDDGQFKGAVAVVPFSNTTVDKGCRLESVIGMPKGELTFVQGSGFEPNEELATNSESYGEKYHGSSKAEADGSFFAATLPYVLGKSSGNTVFEVRGKNCDPKLTFSWGTYQLQ